MVVKTNEYLAQSGILGMKWGIRRFQNPDGSLTKEGKKRYGKGSESKLKNFSKKRTEVQEKVKEENAKPLTKEEVIKSGDVNTILKNAKTLSASELQEALNRINRINDLRKIKLDEEARNQPAMKKLLKQGKMEAEKIIGNIAKNTATDLAKAGVAIAGKKLIDVAIPNASDSTKDALLKAVGAETTKETAKKERDKAVDKVIKSGDANAILKNAKNMTNDELKQALNRVSNLNAIEKIIEAKKEKDKKD